MNTLEHEISNLSGKDLAYWERNQLLLYLTNIFPSWLEKHPIEDIEWETNWRNIVFIKFPEGNFSWHIQDNEYKYFKHLPFIEGNSWDGKTREEKYFLLREKTVNIILAGKIPIERSI